VIETDDADEATWMLILAVVVSAFLVAVGLLQLSFDGDVGDFFRNVGIGLLLLAFSVGFYRKWHRP
jgi:high-affinity Fe2+/Pb2+ permease